MKSKARSDIGSALDSLKAKAAKGDSVACAELFEAALVSIHHLEALSRDAQTLATLKYLSGFFEELPTTYRNPAHIAARTDPDRFVPMGSGERLRVSLASLLPFKIVDTRKRGKPRADDLLNYTLQMFVRGVCYCRLAGSLDIHQRISAAGNSPAAWADEFVSWVKRNKPESVLSAAGAFHKVASDRLEVKRRSQLNSSRGRSYDGDNLWPQFQHVVTRRLVSILAAKTEIPSISE